MRRLSITARVALMCTLTTAVIAALALLAVAVGEQRMLSEYYRDTLMSAGSIADGAVTWDKGRIEIDRDLDDMDDVRAAVYTTDGDLIYGREEFSAGFEEGMRRLEGGGWYVLDTIVTDGANKAWLRLYMSPGAGEGLGSYWTRLMLVIVPALVIISGLGGYAVAKRAVKPVGSIAATARSIAAQ